MDPKEYEMAFGYKEEPEPPADPPSEVVDLEALERGKWLDKIRFSWRSEDDGILRKIEAAAGEMLNELFGEAMVEVDRFYEALRVPLYRDGARVVDSEGRQVWKVENGKLVESWDQLTGQDIEQTLMNLQRIKMSLSLDINRLKNEAVFAKMSADDVKYDNWGKIMTGTVGDREARVNRDSRQDRYHAYFRYYLWSTADTFYREIIDFIFRLKDIRYWRIQGQER
jgi:hypothetical protein